MIAPRIGATPQLFHPSSGRLWSLPAGGSVKPHSGRICPACGFELCLFSPRAPPSRAYPLCPSCFDDSLDDGAAGIASTGADVDASAETFAAVCASGSPHGESHPAVAPLVACACPVSGREGGALLLDPRGGPEWRLVSTRASFAYRLPPFIHSLRVGAPCGCDAARGGDGVVGCRFLHVEFHRDYSPIEGGGTAHTGCLRSDELLQALCEFEEAGGRGRGRGKGGKGSKGSKAKGGKGGKGGGRGGAGKG